MSKFQKIDLSGVTTISIKKRKSKVRSQEFAGVFDPARGSFRAFVDSLPHILVAEDMRTFVGDVVRARAKKRPVIAMIGAHVVKVGLSPLLVDLVERGIVTCVAMNSAAAIHDVETAKWGTTSEDVEANLQDGTFGMSRETGDFINGVLSAAMKQRGDTGYGEALGAKLQDAPHRAKSILASCYRLGVPATVHAAIGTDIIHQQPTMDGAATGELSFRDFRLLCDVVKDLRGGVIMNIGSAVILPEVFLKALTVGRNLGHGAAGFTTANFDMLQHYRPRMNVVARPTKNAGKGYMFTGHHEIMIPLLCAMIKDRLRAR
jgi:hypothetical protein